MAVVEVERDMMQIEEFMTALFSNDFWTILLTS